jgi:hypothetical protein
VLQSSSEGTHSDYSSDTIAEIIKNASKRSKSKPKSKPKQKPYQKTKIPAPEEAVAEETSVLNHLTPHLSGDPFRTSNLNSPNHPKNKFLNVTSETSQGPVIQEPPIISVQEPPLNFVVSEQNNPNTTITSEPDKQPPTQTFIPESPPQNIEISHPEQIQHPPSDQCDDIPSDNQEHHIPKEPTPAESITNDTLPPSPPTYGPFYKPLTIDELVLPVDFALPILEALLKAAINIDDDVITTSKNPTIDLSKIKIIPL